MPPDAQIRTERLRLVAATSAIERAAASGAPRLARALAAEVPPQWPPPLAADVLGYWAERLDRDPELSGWTSWYWLLAEPERRELLIGYGGFKGAPDDDGTVEVGYGVLAPFQRRGIATEAVGALVAWALAHEQVERVIAHTLPELKPSQRVLEKLGFRRMGAGAEPGTIRFELERAR